ncbi:hypothetical protein Tco_1175573 [Tanacetum coccineum]
MQADELYKFSDGTLKTVRDELHHRILDFHLGCNKEMSRRKWTAIDKRISELMVELIDKQMRKRRIIRNLERLVDSHHGPSDAMHNPSQPLKNIRVILKSIHSDDENPSRANIKQALRIFILIRCEWFEDWGFGESDSVRGALDVGGNAWCLDLEGVIRFLRVGRILVALWCVWGVVEEGRGVVVLFRLEGGEELIVDMVRS